MLIVMPTKSRVATNDTWLLQERKRELERAVASLHFKGGCANAKALIADSGEDALSKQRISFWWPYEQEWYSGAIESVQAKNAERQHARMQIIFDDGDSLNRSITSSIWRLVCPFRMLLSSLYLAFLHVFTPTCFPHDCRVGTLCSVYLLAPATVISQLKKLGTC